MTSNTKIINGHVDESDDSTSKDFDKRTIHNTNVSIKDLAQQLSVSKTSISRIMNSIPNFKDSSKKNCIFDGYRILVTPRGQKAIVDKYRENKRSHTKRKSSSTPKAIRVLRDVIDQQEKTIDNLNKNLSKAQDTAKSLAILESKERELSTHYHDLANSKTNQNAELRRKMKRMQSKLLSSTAENDSGDSSTQSHSVHKQGFLKRFFDKL